MNILFIGYRHQYFHQAKLLADASHNVYIATGAPTLDEYSLSIGAVGVIKTQLPAEDWTVENCTWITDAITAHSITHVINGIPWVHWVRGMMPAGVTYLGPTQAAAEMETNKFATVAAVKLLGLKTSDFIDDGSSSAIANALTSNTERPLLIKPKTSFMPSVTLRTGEDAACITRLTAVPDYDFYMERYIPNLAVEVSISFVISNGSWAITHMEAWDMATTIYHSNGVIGSTWDWQAETIYQPLTSAQATAATAFATTFLNWAVLKGGNYEGDISLGMDTSDVAWWIELASRPYSMNPYPIFCTAAEYIQSLTSDPTIIADAWPATSKFTTVSLTANQSVVYPFTLHATHNVRLPMGLGKIGSVYYLEGGCVIHSDGDLPSGFVTAINATSNCSIA